jgi:hypothetical protein
VIGPVWRASIVAVGLLFASGPATAQRKPPTARKQVVKPPEPPRPWADGVPEEAQRTALALYEQGNKLFVEKSYAEALKLYREALTSWDHPAIRFNMAECLISLDQPLEAYAHVIASLKYGEPALGPEHFERATRTLQLLEGQLAYVEVSCSEPGAVLTLDGQPLFVGPGRAKRTLLPGSHQIVASKPGYQTVTREDVLIPRKTLVAEVRLVRSTTLEHRWKRWKPWAVVGGGVAISLLGLVFRGQAQASYDEFHEGLAAACPLGCVRSSLPADVIGIEDRGQTYNAAATTSYVIGGAAIIVGVVLVLLNNERAVEAPLPKAVQVNGTTGSLVWTF